MNICHDLVFIVNIPNCIFTGGLTINQLLINIADILISDKLSTSFMKIPFDKENNVSVYYCIVRQSTALYYSRC